MSEGPESPPIPETGDRGDEPEAVEDRASSEMARILDVKSKYEQTLLRKKNVIGLGVGYREKDGKVTDQMVLTVLVRRKQEWSQLQPQDLIPSEIDGVPIDVKEVGTLTAF